MSIKKFISSVVDSLGLKHFAVSGKKKSIKNLLHKLKKRRLIIYKDIKEESDKNSCNELYEELDIISMQIQKGKKLLNQLNGK